MISFVASDTFNIGISAVTASRLIPGVKLINIGTKLQNVNENFWVCAR